MITPLLMSISSSRHGVPFPSDPPEVDTNRRILMIDDDPVILAMAADALSDAGFEVRTANTLEEFYRSTVEWRPEIVMTDIRMPEMNGDKLCRLVKSRLPGIPVVFFSGLPDDELAAIAKACSADGYARKREGLEGLVTTVRQLCEWVLW